MKKFIVLIFILIALAGCSLKDDENQTKSYMILDQDTNKVLNNYEYSSDGKTLLSTKSYAGDQSVKKIIEYEYDDKGYLESTVETLAGSSPKTVTYDIEEIYDSLGRLEKTVRTSSEGDVIETYYGYDESGTLRGVVEQINKGAVIMKDYSTYWEWEKIWIKV